MRRIAGLAAFVILAGILSGVVFGFSAAARADDPWMVLPPTPALPKAVKSGLAPVDGIKVWYAEFGPANGAPIILLHGGLGNSNYFGNQVPALSKKYRVILMDSRGHGRSSRDSQAFGYDLMATDVVALMDYLHVKKAAIVGWSDGAIIGLDIAIHHPERLTKLFAFAANSDPNGVADISKSTVFNDYIARTQTEYEKMSPTPKEYQPFLDQISKMWGSQPNFTKEQLGGITTPTWIVDADHDEAIKRENTEFMAANIPHAGLLLLPQVSHFAFLQDPKGFMAAIQHFMETVPDAKQ
jgi:pimeloyl-ACP methyl ester carboxylesterase